MPSSFVDRTLGPWSSHPDSLRSQRLKLVFIGLAPLALLIAIACLWLTDFDAWCSLFKHPGAKALVFFGAICMSAAFIMAMSLMNMVSVTLATQDNDGYGRDNMQFPLWLVLTGAFFWLAPYGLSLCRLRFWDGPYFGIIQFVLNLLCFLPFVIVVLWTVFAREKPKCGEGERVVHPKLPFVVAALFFFLAVYSLFTDICATAIRHFPKLEPRLGGYNETLVRVVLLASLIPLGVICWSLGKLLWTVKKARRPGKTAGEGESADTAEEQPDYETEPESVKWIVANLPEGVTAEGVECSKGLEEFSPLATGEGAAEENTAFFGGITPTEDQYAFLRRFQTAYAEALCRFLDNQKAGEPVNCADMIIQGVDGSGRTEALLAAAAYSAIVRGQNVLFIVQDEAFCKILAERVNARFSNLMVDSYFRADVAVPLSIAAWIKPDGAVPEPNILFGTPGQVESCLFSTEISDSPERIQALKRLIVGYNVVLVDDFMEYPLSVRSHLAFVIDKLRLVQSSECAVPQMVISTSPLFAPEGVEELGKRLFGLGEFNRLRNVMTLRPRPCAPYWHGTLRVKSGLTLDKVSRELVKVGLQGQFSTLLYNKGLSEVEKDSMESDFRDAASGVQFKVLSRLYEVGDADACQDTVFYLSIVCGNADVALRLNLPESEDSVPVFFKIALEGESDEVSDSRFALLPDETALAMRAMHLRSVLPFISRLTPISERIWSHFGISMKHPCVRKAVLDRGKGSGVALKWLYDASPGDSGYGDDELWPYFVLHSKSAANGGGGVADFNSLPNTREGIWLEKNPDADDCGCLVLAKPAQSDSDNRRQMALWTDGRGGNVLGVSDLAHADEFVMAHGDDEYTAIRIVAPTEKNDAARYAVNIIANFRRGSDADFTIPIRRLSWQVPYGGLVVPDIREQESLAFFRMDRRGGLSFDVSGRLVGLMNLRGEPDRRTPRSFGYDAYLSCLVLLPSISLEDEEEEEESRGGAEKFIRNCLSGAWSTDAKSGYSPALTHALTAAFRQHMAGWSFFTVAPVFYTEGREGSVGKVTMWLVEPTNSGQSVYPALELLLDQNAAFRKGVFEKAREILGRAKTIEELRLASRLAFADETLTDDDRAQALQILDMMISGDKRPAEEGEPKPGKDKKPKPAPVRVLEDSYTDAEREFDAKVVAGLLDFDPTIDVTEFVEKYGWDVDKISDLFMDVLWNNPQIFYVSKRGRYQWWKNSDGKIVRFVITDILYGIPQDKYDVCKRQLDEEVSKAMETVSGVEDPVEKARILHDYIVKVCDYDVVAAEEDDRTPLARTVYSVLVRRKAVCEGYTMAYRYLLHHAGIRSEEVVSEKMCHCWNYVQIGGKWYHVDVTWDDPVYQGRRPDNEVISRENFLMSDTRARFTNHVDWQSSLRGLPPADDKSFDGKDWGKAR